MLSRGTDEGISDPYVIAEIGVNHFDIAEERSISPMSAAKDMIEAADRAGADAVKFQSYSADKLASTKSPAYWDIEEEPTETQYELFQQYDDFGAEEFRELARWTKTNSHADFLSTPFDFRAVEYLEDLVPAYKIASADVTNHPLLRQVSERNKPILLSTGASTISEIDEAVRIIENEMDNPDLCLLHCILDYPTDPEDANLRMMDHLADIYPGHDIGYSDHVVPDSGMVTLLHAAMRGAEIIEKHFTLDKTLSGNDHYHAMDASDLRAFRSNMEILKHTAGQRKKTPIPAESDSRRHARRSLVATQKIERGDQISRDQLTTKRPGTGISPVHLDIVVGREARRQLSVDEVVSWQDV